MIASRIAMIRRLVVINRNWVTYTRELLKQESIDPDTLKKQETDLRNQQIKEYVDKLPSNDKIPEHLIKVKVNHPLLMGDKPQLRSIPNPYILKTEPRSERVLIAANKRFIKTSLKKYRIGMKEALWMIKKMHVSEAIQHLLKSEKKVARVLLPTFFNLLDHAQRKGLQPYRLFVHGLILGKQDRYTGLRYKAKSRSSKQKTDFCQIKVILYEMPAKEFFMKMAEGKAPAGFAFELKRLFAGRGSFEDIRKFRYILTARGRQQLRELTKRKVYNKMQENLKNNLFVPKKVLTMEFRDEMAKKMEEEFNNFVESAKTSNIKLRQELFKKNSS